MGAETSNGCFDPDKLVLKLKVTLSADKNAVDPVVQGIMDVVRNMQCATGKEDAIELALTEALANAVVHGAKGDPQKLVPIINSVLSRIKSNGQYDALIRKWFH